MKRKFIAGLFVLSCSGLVQAAEQMTWDQCVKLAAQNNPDLISAQKSIEARRVQYFGSYNELMPRLNLSSSYNDSKFHDPDSRWQANGTASMDIFNPARYADIKASASNLEQAEANYQVVTASILFNLRQAFASLLFSQEEVQVSKQVRDLRAKNAEMITLRYDSGRESKGNMMRAKAELLQSDADIAQSVRDLRAAQQEFNHQIGQDEFQEVVATGTLGIELVEGKPQDWNSIAGAHPNVIVQKSNLSLARANLAQSRSPLWPTLTANYSRSYSGSTYFPSNPNWTASGVVSLPFLSGGPTAAYYDVMSGKRNLEKAEQDLRSAINQVKSDLESAWSGLAGAVDQEKVQTAFLAAARQRNGEADIRYSSGLLSFDNWEPIVTDRVNFERSLIRAKRDAIVADAQWKKSLGKGLGDEHE